jgi:REP element-mobilizing transposase RayT
MARALRIEFPGALYHVMARGNARQRIFIDDTDRHMFLQTLTRAADRHSLRCHAYCLMPNHYHVVLDTPLANLSTALRHVNGVYAQAFNRRHGRVGHVFQGRFRALLVEAERYLLGVVRYVSLNPVRGRRCKHPGDWPWSSYLAIAGYVPAPAFLTVDLVLAHFGEDDAAARRRFEEFVNEPGARPLELRAAAGVVLGGPEFVARHGVASHASTEIPRLHRLPVQPPLADIFERHPRDGIRVAYREHGYRMSQIADFLGVHYATVSRRLRQLEAASASHRKT